MTRIIYKTVGERAEMRSFFSDDGLKAEVEIVPKTDGYIVIGDRTFPLCLGRATVDLEGLSEGEYTPVLFGDSTLALEPIRREKGKITFPGTPDTTVRNLLLRAERLEEEVERLKCTLDEVKSALGQKIIF